MASKMPTDFDKQWTIDLDDQQPDGEANIVRERKFLKPGYKALLKYKANRTIPPQYRWEITKNTCKNGSWEDFYVPDSNVDENGHMLLGGGGTMAHSWTTSPGESECVIRFYNGHLRYTRNIKIVTKQ